MPAEINRNKMLRTSTKQFATNRPVYISESRVYFCKKAESEVNVTSKILILADSVTGEVYNKVRVSFDCNQKFKCGIDHDSCKLVSFNWLNCINPICIELLGKIADIPVTD